MKLGDDTTKKTIKIFLDEARACAQYRKDDDVNIHGYAAMLTAFSCVFCVGEVLERHRHPEKYPGTNYPSDKVSVQVFSREMEAAVDWHSWLLPPKGKSIDAIEAYRGKRWKLLYDLRNALVHAVSISPYVAMVPGKEWVQSERFKEKWCIVVPEFVNAVEKTFEQIVDDDKNSAALWDPAPRSVRRLATFIYVGHSAGSPAIEEATTPVDTTRITELSEYISRLSDDA